MKFTKKQETECMQVYETWWNSYLNGDVKTYDSFLADDFHFVGSTNGEEYLNKKDTTAFFDATAYQLAGKAELRNIKRTIEDFDGGLVLITDLADAYVLSEPEWVFYSRFRFTSIMKETSNGWRFIYQHFSAPDSKAQEGETLGTEQITKENQELRDAIKRRTVELESKNRELEIEFALEKVRARTMAMQNSEELADVSVLLFEQLKLLDISTYSSGFSIWENETLISWMCNADGSINPPFSLPMGGDVWHRLQYESWKNGEAFICKDLQGEEMQSHFRYLRSFPLLDEAFKKSIAAGHPMPERQVHHVANFSRGNLLFITLQPCPEAHDLFIRFAKVFEQTYTRFLDLQKAETQARDAKIEIAVERVRAKALAMHKSEELHEVVVVLKKELMGLQIPEVAAVTLYLEHDENHIRIVDLSDSGEMEDDPTHMKLDKIFNHEDLDPDLWIWKILNDDRNYFVLETYEEDFERIVRWLYKIDKEEARMAEKIISEKSIKRAWLPTVRLLKGKLNIDLLQPPTPEIESILLKMGAGFDLAYKRFLDLQKAESQAREAQIETGLERVRSRSLAMHHTSELQEVIHTVHKELLNLKIAIYGGSFIAINSDIDSTLRCWGSGGTADTSEEIHLPLYEKPFCTHLINRIKNSPGFFTEEYTQQEKKDFFTFLFKYEPWSRLDDEKKQETLSSPGGYTRSCCVSKYTSIFIINHLGERFTAADNDILQRFAKVFEQSYTRFQDLQKAEAQAREAKIEAALERTRTQSMIMQHSKELDDTLRVFHEQVLLLGIPSAFSFLWLPDEKNDRHIFWAAWGEKINGLTLFKSKAINYPLDRNEPATAQCLVDWKSNEPVYSYHVAPAAVESYFAVWQELIDGVDHLQPEYFSGGLHYVEAFMKYGCFGVMVVNDLTEDEKKLLSRFANEFERTYTRFLDLQKSEAQAREAQIEVSLERVRSRAMAMQRSSELGAVTAVLFAQMNQLVSNLWTCGFVLCEKFRDEDEWWLSMDGDFTRGFFLPNIGDYAHATLYEGWLCGDALRAVQLDGEVLQQHYDWLMDIPVSRAIFEEMDAAGLARPDWQKLHAAYFSKGYLVLITREPCGEEEIFKRFAQVFDQTYTRFLDLQKAEAQTREAEIELGLERVRARAMAMQKSDELSDLVDTVFKELTKLDFALNWCIINIINEPSLTNMVWAANPETNKPPESYLMKFEDYPFHHSMLKAYRERKTKHVYVIEGEERKTYDNYLFSETEWRRVPKVAQDASRAMKRYVATFTFSNFGGLQTVGEEHLSEENLDILSRFGKVFDLTYTRFNDLQKAEAQAREAQIEAALERVRSRSIGMQKSEELKDVIKVVYDQLGHLKIKLDHAGFVVDYKPGGDWHFWIADERDIPSKISHPYFDSVWANQFKKAKEKGSDFFATRLNFEEKNNFYNELLSYVPGLPEASKDFYLSCPGLAASTVLLENVGLYIENFSGTPYTEEENNTLLRFGKVFQQTYTRFLDLQKAEAQARESKIEAALEKARSRTMGMQSSDELPEVANVLFLEVQGLGIPAWSCGYNILAEDKTSATCCMSSEGTLQTPFKLRLFGEASFAEMGDFLRSEQTMLVQELGGQALEEHYAFMKSFPDLKPTFDQIDELGLSLPTYQINHLCKFTQGFLLFITYEKVPDSHDIFKRFTKVFEQTYTRFLDLQKAEAQAREAQIELGLERVRARAMSMQNSDELKELIGTVSTELSKLHIDLDRCFIMIYDPITLGVTWWISNPEDPLTPMALFVKYHEYAPHLAYIKAWQEHALKWVYTLEGENKKNWDAFLFSETDLSQLPGIVIENMRSNEKVYLNASFNNFGCLTIATLEPLPEEHFEIMLRFAKVFELTYTRFNDLKNAEAQTREAQINLAVERVRARALSMFKSEEILQVVHKLKEEIVGLNIPNVIAATIHLKENDGRCRIWDISSVEINEKSLHHPMDISYDLEETDPNFFMRRIWGNTNNYFVEMQDESDLQRTIQWLRDNERNQQADETELFIQNTKLKKLYHPTIKLNNGRMCIDLLENPEPEIASILEKMGAAFDLAYKRFEDLKNSEAQLRESQIEAALEKVRSRTLAMQHSNELAETSAVLFKQLIILGIEPNRLYITVIEEESGEAAFWITDENGSKVSPAYRDNLNLNPTFKKMLEGWKAKAKSLILDIRGAELQEYFSHLSSLHVSFKEGVKQKRRIQHLAYFNHGFIGMASPDEQPESTMQLLERFAAVFNLTYTRFNDLQLAEAHAIQAEEDLVKLQTEKKRAEEALNDLQSAQKQLIQAEKMASLGELTAGIAHEIQNPLNFVNNFSEVSKELLDEMQSAIESGNDAEVRDIMQDIIQNLEKITVHGKRADAIVKGMLQHSRSNNGQKELTDINALADEYFRLAYHGLRAKDKSFNASMKTDFDETIGNINIIPQDIGRVILNLITNAFYVVDEKKKQIGEGYEPIVSVSTKKANGKVEIGVADNANGIPQKVLDKIFQPFFTTKPAGQGTGLGLSLSYDIVKAHGGELSVETREGEGSEFIIELPV